MPTTTNFGWTTPADTDLVKDGASAIRTLGSAIDTSLVDLKGGTTDQYLAKNSNTDLDYKWVTASSAGLAFISTTTFSAVASQSINSIFSSTYDNYLMTLRIDATADTQLNFRMRTASDDSGSVYGFAHYRIDGAANSPAYEGNGNAQTAGRFGNANNSPINNYSAIIFSPNLAQVTAMDNTLTMPNNTGTGLNVQTFGGNIVGTSTQYTGITIFPVTGTITGSVSVYGYVK